MKVSVAIPCFNAAPFIGETLESILKQTRPADEIIVADDCSTDGSADIVRQFPQVKLVQQERNSGCAASRNLGIRASSGDLVAIVDADDIWVPTHLEASTDLLTRFPECGYVFSDIFRFPEDGMTYPIAVTPGKPVDLFDQLLDGNFVRQPTVVFRRTLFDAVGGFDASMRYCEDYDLWLQFSLRGPALYSGVVGAGYRTHAGQLNRHFLEMFKATWYARKRALQTVERETMSHSAAAVKQRLGEVWAKGLHSAWAFRSRESLDFMLSMADEYPEQRAAARRWRRLRTVWPLMVAAGRLSSALPGPVREAIRPTRGAAMARI